MTELETRSKPSLEEIAAAVGRAVAASAPPANTQQAAAPSTRDGSNQRLAAVYLFGSFARGNPGPRSDIDLGLLYAEPPGGRLQDQPFLLEAELSEALARPVQCVVMNRAPADLVHRVLRDQRLLLDLEPSLRVRFEVAARNRYFDLKPFLAVSEPGERRVTDPDLLEKKLAFIETCVSELQRLAIADKIDTDLKERRFIEHTLQLAIQACLDAASHVVSDDRLGEPNTNQELFRLLARAGRLSQELARSLSAAAGFRNVLVRGYAEVDSRVTRDVP